MNDSRETIALDGLLADDLARLDGAVSALLAFADDQDVVLACVRSIDRVRASLARLQGNAA